MEIKITDIKILREETGAGMMDCKKALAESNGNIDGARRLLREWGLAGVAKRSDRPAREGVVCTHESNNSIALIELACETDFVAKNDQFKETAKTIAKTAVEKSFAAPTPELEALVSDIASKIKENIVLKTVILVKANSGEYIHSYIHGDGRLGVVIKVRSSKPEIFGREAVKTLIHDIALQVAAMNPMFIDKTKAPAKWIEEQKSIIEKQMEQDASMKDKPEKVVQNIAVGKLQKLLSELSLVDQIYIKDNKLTVQRAIDSVLKAGEDLEILEYLRVLAGEDA